MKIVQSFWSAPSFRQSHAIQNRSAGGWLDASYNYFSWAYSCLQFKKYYDEVELVTDTRGKEILIDLLELPYSNFTTQLDCLSGFDPDLWAVGKLHAYKLQDGPFIHADGDVIIWDRFDKNLEDSDLLAQNVDMDFEFYHDTLSQIKAHFTYIPEVIPQYFSSDGNKVVSINAGIIGGKRTDFFKSYVEEALLFIHKNGHHLDKIKKGKFNTIFEQYLFACMARSQNIKVNYFHNTPVNDYTEFVDITNIPRKSQYFHPVGLFKKEEHIGRELEYRFRMDYPEHYFHIAELITKRYI